MWWRFVNLFASSIGNYAIFDSRELNIRYFIRIEMHLSKSHGIESYKVSRLTFDIIKKPQRYHAPGPQLLI